MQAGNLVALYEQYLYGFEASRDRLNTLERVEVVASFLRGLELMQSKPWHTSEVSACLQCLQLSLF